MVRTVNTPDLQYVQSDTYSLHFERYRKVLNRLLTFDFALFDIPKTARILDVGCGYGDDIKKFNLLGYANVAGVEPDPRCVEMRGDLEIRRGTLEETGFDEASFDVVFVDNVFHHVSDYKSALREVHRLLKPRGTLCFIEPRNSIFRIAMDVLTFKTPLPKFSKNVKLRHDVMIQEINTGLYPKWLASHRNFFDLLDESFETIWIKKTFFFYMGKIRKI